MRYRGRTRRGKDPIAQERARRCYELHLLHPTWSKRQIAEQLISENLGGPNGTLNDAQISQALHQQELFLRERFITHAETLKLEQSARLDCVIEHALSAYERSGHTALETTVTVEQSLAPPHPTNAPRRGQRPPALPPSDNERDRAPLGLDYDPYENPDNVPAAPAPPAHVLQLAVDKVTTTRIQQHPNPTYLKIAMEAQAHQREIWGLNAPKRTDVTSNNQPIKAYVGVALDDV